MRRQNRYNPKGLHRDHRGRLLDKWGREMEVNWDEFEKRRVKTKDVNEPYLKPPAQMNPLHNATGAIHKVSEMLESTNWDAKIKKMEKSTKGFAKKATKTIKGWEKGLGKARPKDE